MCTVYRPNIPIYLYKSHGGKANQQSEYKKRVTIVKNLLSFIFSWAPIITQWYFAVFCNLLKIYFNI